MKTGNNSRNDLLSKCDAFENSCGPLYSLKKKLNQEIKVKIRRGNKMPFVSRVLSYKGTLVMFDAHLNIVLKNVVESFLYEYDGKTLARARHLDRLMIRGDNIIVINF